MKEILVVDDERDIAEALRAVLEAEGYAVRTCADGIACLHALQERQPDLVLLDIMMPRLDGFGVLEKLRDFENQPPVLMMSAVRPVDRLADYDDVLAGFIRKPFELDALLGKVEDLLQAA